MNTTTQTNRPQSAATDVSEFVTNLDGGQFEVMLSTALSRVAAAVIDHDRKGKVSISFDVEKIPGTHQVRIKHGLRFTSPTLQGSQSEEVEAATVLHVGKYGAVTLAQGALFGSQLPIA